MKKMKLNDTAEPTAAVAEINPDRFFQGIIERRIADAEKELDTIRSTIPATETGKGYLKGLEGLLLSVKSNDDRYLYLARLERKPTNLKTIRKEFTLHTKNKLHTDYDIGYFRALESFMRKLERSEPQKSATEEDDKRRT